MSKNDGPSATSFLASSKTGWLTKHGGSGIKGNWKKRWFVLDHHYLFYYETVKDKHPKGIICLPDYKECRRAEKAECQKKHSFILIPDPDLVEPGTTARTYYIYGDSEDECNNWVDAILEEMRPTVGIQKQKEKAKSLPEHTKTKISSSVKVTKKDLDAVTTAAAIGGPQLTHLTKERAQAPKRRPPRKFKPMDEDDDPAISVSEASQLQPSPSKKPAVDNVNDKSNNHLASPVKNLSDSSPKVSGKKPVLPPSSSKPKVDVTGGINKERASPSLKVKGNPPVPPPKVYKELEHNGMDEAKDTTSPPLKESKDETMDTTDGSTPTSPPVTKPKPLRGEDNKSINSTGEPPPESSSGTPNSNVEPKPVKEEVVDNTKDDSPAVTPTSGVPLTKPEPLEEPVKECPETIDAIASSITNDQPSTKPSGTVESVESLDAPVTSITAPPPDSEPPTKTKSSDSVESNIPSPSVPVSVAANKSSDSVESNIPSPSVPVSVAANRPFVKPKPPAKHPRPKSIPSKDRNLIEETNDKLSTEKHVAEKTDKPVDGFSGQVKAKETKNHVESSLEAPDIQETAEKVSTQDTVVTKEGEEKEVVMRKTAAAPDKVSIPRPKPKPRTSGLPKTPSAISVLLPADKKITADEGHCEDVKDKLDGVKDKLDNGKAKEVENSVTPTVTETGGNVNNEDGDVDKGQVIKADEEVIAVTPGEQKATIEVDNMNGLYSVVELNRISEERECKGSGRNSRETTPKHHDYDLVAISPRSKSPEEEDPGYDEIGGVVEKEPVSAKESIYDNWKLKKAPETSSSKAAEDTANSEEGYSVVYYEVQNQPLADDLLPVPATATVPQYAKVHKHTKTQQSKALDGVAMDDNAFDALSERLESSIPAHLDEAKEMLRLAMVARQEAEQLKKEAAEDREAARRERMEAEQLKKNATEMLEMAKEKTTS